MGKKKRGFSKNDPETPLLGIFIQKKEITVEQSSALPCLS
jgi:hypothetical protein